MFIQSKLRLIRVVLTFVLTALIAVAIFTPNLQQSTHAGPSHEVYHTYYSGPDYGTVVGEKWVLCYGTFNFGQQTQWVVTYDSPNECN
jgi:hypothetical protein